MRAKACRIIGLTVWPLLPGEAQKALDGIAAELDEVDGLFEQYEALKVQADLDAERAAILSSAVGRARLLLNDASKETTALIDAALASYPAKRPT